jgi:hypothetical protein
VSLPAEDLAAHGYVRAVDDGQFYDFFAPNAEVLLSDEFLDHHCLSLQEGRKGLEGMIGLGFEPVRGRKVPEIEGSLWLDRKSAELRLLEFRYTGLDARVPGEGAGGRVEFAALPDGAWIVRAWAIRTPILTEARVHWGGQSHIRPRVIAIREEGGEVMRTYTLPGQPIDVTVRAELVGVLHDSTASAPLAGAVVRLSGTSYMTMTDATGRFRLTGVPAGTYGAEFSHPRLDSLPISALPPTEVVLEAGRETWVELAIPPLSTILAAACPPPEADEPEVGAAPGAATGVLVGFLRDMPTGRPVPGAAVHDTALSANTTPAAAVSLSWIEQVIAPGATAGTRRSATVTRQPWRVEVPVDESGRFWVCQLPLNLPIHLTANWADGRTAITSFRLNAELQLLELSPRPAGGEQEFVSQVEIEVVEEERGELEVIRTRPLAELGRDGAVVGRLQDMETGQPISGARIGLDGKEFTIAGAHGDFRFPRVDAGPRTLDFQHLAYGHRQESLEVEAGTEALVVMILAPQPIALDPVVVTGVTQREIEARRSVTRRDLVAGPALVEAMRRGNTIADVVRRFPGISVQEGRFATMDGVGHGVCIQSNRRMARLVLPKNAPAGATYCEAVPVYLDGIRVGNSVEFLRGLRLDDFESIEFMGALEASIRYGTAAASAGGALLLRTHRGKS